MANTPVRAESTLRVIDHELTEVLQAKVISGLDALRALAVSLVLADHYLVTDHLFHAHPQLGWLGVMIFFVLSGFLITSILLREHEETGSISLREFYRRRAFRIFPAFYCCWMVELVVDLAVQENFYLLWPLLLILLLRKRSTMLRTMLLIILGLWIYRAVLYLGLGVWW